MWLSGRKGVRLICKMSIEDGDWGLGNIFFEVEEVLCLVRRMGFFGRGKSISNNSKK